ncbi:hypothetical protein BDBG_17341 [Blastomyces gilchristii SLH14081]|uniref:Uncharacterized protein n=1 Tax=Blastomyces gilchristii (strain SLH14081) TaxID=559298 RepID=A0A179UV58_BLAGS|nr:uncharacterized protein BDBG_17341 [Blastomyces gilchristii SLH14081]OAT10282.1 hypothetical protein BDBG_17341 [Blastomyces gilchristii SLH14081]
MRKLLHVATTLILTGLPTALSGRNHASYRCQPEDPCWPSPRKWKRLNESVEGNLVAVRPVGSVCHDPTYDLEACVNTKNISHNSFWRAEQPGAVKFPNWETWPTHQESCYVDSPRGDTCDQGQVSLSSVLAESLSHIQKAAHFA